MSGKYRIGSGMALALFAAILVKTLLPGSRHQPSVSQVTAKPEIAPKGQGTDAAAKLDLEKIRREASRNPSFLNGTGLEKSADKSQRASPDHPYLFLQDEDNSWLEAVSIEQKALLPTGTTGQHSIPGNSFVMGYQLTKATTLSISYNKKSGEFDAIAMKRYFSE